MKLHKIIATAVAVIIAGSTPFIGHAQAERTGPTLSQAESSVPMNTSPKDASVEIVTSIENEQPDQPAHKDTPGSLPQTVHMPQTGVSTEPPGKPAGSDETNEPQKSNMVITSYKVYGQNTEREVRQVTKGSRVDIEVLVKNTEITTNMLASGVSVTKPIDSFRYDATPEITVLSSGPDPLTFRVRFSGLVYSGEGTNLKFVVSYPGLAVSYDTGEINVLECVEYVKKTNSEQDEDQKEAENAAVPIIQISRGELPREIRAESAFKLTVNLKNLSGREDIENLTVTFDATDALMILDATPSRVIPSLPAKKDVDLTLNLKTTKDIPQTPQFITAQLKFDYLPGGIRKQGSATEKILIPLVPTDADKKVESATPNIIIAQYDYGGEPVAAGKVVDLKLQFQNTSVKLPVENIVMKLDTGESLSITESSNAFYFPSLGAGQKEEQSVQVLALAGGKPESNKIEITFQYEFVDQEKREKATVSEKLAIPIFQPDRFEIKPPTPPENVYVGEETVLTFEYVNKGRGELYNVEATLEGTIQSLAPHQNLGNYEAGKSGTIDFIVTPQESGIKDLVVKIVYEDVNMNAKELKFPLKLTAVDPVPITEDQDNMGMEEVQQPAPNKWIIWVLAGAVLIPIALLMGGRMIREAQKAKRAAAQRSDSLIWEEAVGTEQSEEERHAEK